MFTPNLLDRFLSHEQSLLVLQDLEDEEEPEQRSRADQLQELLLESFAAGMEGLMLKTLDAGAAYQPSKRSDSWVKLKRCASGHSHFSLPDLLQAWMSFLCSRTATHAAACNKRLDTRSTFCSRWVQVPTAKARACATDFVVH